MSFGLNSLLKKFLPKRLFYRALIIVAAPIVLLQLIISVVFFDSIWIKANKGMTKSLVSEVKTLFETYRSGDTKNVIFLTNLYKKNFDFVINIKKDENLPTTKSDRRFSPMDRSLRRELKPVFGNNYWFDTVTYLDLVDLRIRTNNEIIQVFFPKSKIAPSSVRVFVLWITLPSFILILIAILFLRNQTRPILKLSKAAERFGRGERVDDLRPSGASEIRKATIEFDKMMKRINKHLNQRSEMLSGISHDLRTPLTRIKLQLAFIKDKELSNKLSEDVIEMEKMLNEYLQFSKNKSSEKGEKFDLSKLLINTIKKYSNKNISSEITPNVLFHGKQNLITRCISNILDNSLKYGKIIEVKLKKSNNIITLIIEDDGPGIPKSEYENVFKPFYKIDKSRSESKSSVGLGMSIASDIIQSHGGNIKLDKSILSGLQVRISLPF